MFVGRKKELKYLEDNYKKQGNQLIVLYGHKGVGKTALMSRFVQGKPAAYYDAKPLGAEEQLYMWNHEMGYGISPEELSFDAIFGKMYDEGMELLEEEAVRLQMVKDPSQLEELRQMKHILMIDEFQYIVKFSEKFMMDLLRFIKEQAHRCMVVLCSSSISFVENGLVPQIGTLAMGISSFFKVQPLNFIDCVHFFEEFTTEECMKTYNILGGYPAYWDQFTTKMSIEGNIEHMMLYSDVFLREEGERVVAAELREVNVYCTILYCLSHGMNKLNELHQHTGYSRAKISVYLKNLMERELVEKVFSFDNASSANAKKGIYRIVGSYLDFYYRFVFGRTSKLNILGPKKFYEQYIRKDIPAFYERQFQKICREYMEILNQQKALPIRAVLIGEWIGKEGTIDLVLQDEDGTNILCFCRWQEERFAMEAYEKCLNTAASAKLNADYVYLFSKGGFDQKLTAMAEKMNNLALVDINTL